VPGTDDSSWGADDIVAGFATDGYTDPGEAAALASVAEWARGDVLDIGVGGGRTTGLLAPTAATYVGLDISPQMLELARARFPDADLREGDAAGLTDLADAAYDLVVFSYNGLDALDHDQRASALAAMARVVRPGGRVLFSSLNLEGVSFDERPWRMAGGLRSPRGRHHVTHAVRHPGSVVRAVLNFRRTRRGAQVGPGWALGPLRAHEFRFLVHFATLPRTVAAAEEAGLAVVAVYADDGSQLDPAAAHTQADYAHFVCAR
jgi:SAM-dependent methyltransferase